MSPRAKLQGLTGGEDGLIDATSLRRSQGVRSRSLGSRWISDPRLGEPTAAVRHPLGNRGNCATHPHQLEAAR